MEDTEIINYTLKPREKMLLQGPSSLSDEELLQIVLGSGIKDNPVNFLAKEVLKTLDNKNGSLKIQDLEAHRGIGLAKATNIVAALEFARRRIRPEGIKIKSPDDIIPLIQHYALKKQEHFLTISLNGAHEVLHTRCVTVGLLNSSQVHPREVFIDPIGDRAASIIIAHNHPSGNTSPSDADISVTKTLIKSGKILGIKLLDHIIITQNNGYLSMRDKGVVNFD